MQEDKLDQLLKTRKFEAASPGLADRILARINEDQSLTDVYYHVLAIFRELIFPKPAYALALSLAIGFVIGFNDSSLLADNSIDIAEFLYNQGGIL